METKKLFAEYNKSRGPIVGTSVCHAAALSLNFEQTGNATACCFNRQFILGTYPQNSIEEIWTGTRIAELRKLFKNNELASGCGLCRQQLEAKNFSGLHARYYDRSFLTTKERQPNTDVLVPRIMEFELSNACNLECVMCNGFFSSSIRKNREKLEPKKSPYDDAFVEQLRPFLPNLYEAKFLGGEPFLNPLYFKIWDLIIDINPDVLVSITTNGSILTPKVKETIKRLKPYIAVSCESLNPKRYESIRVNGDFKTFRANLDFFLSQEHCRQKGLSLAVCPMQQNWMDLPDLLRFCNEHTMSIGFNTVVWPLKYSIKAMPKKEIQKICAFLKDSTEVNPSSIDDLIIRQNFERYNGMIGQIEFWANEASLAL